MNKWEALTIIIIAIAVFTSLTLTDKDTNELAKAGLEECPIEPNSFKTIWVKDCILYLNIYKKSKDK